MLSVNNFRVILGTYLAFHCLDLLSHAEELFGSKMPYDPSLGPNILPNLFEFTSVSIALIGMTALSVLMACNVHPQLMSLFLWYGWASMLNRNPLISNPGIPYVGWLLLVNCLMPNNHKIPKSIYWAAWFLMAYGYTISGIHKLYSPSWIDGTALYHVMNSPLARDNFIRDFMVSLPMDFLKFMTWGALALEVLFLPFGCFIHTRKWFWIAHLFMHTGIIALINFTDLTIGVFMIHIFTYDPNWFACTKKEKYKSC